MLFARTIQGGGKMSKILEKIKILSWIEIEYLVLALIAALLLIFF